MPINNPVSSEAAAIYALTDPETREVRYIGYTKNPQLRLKEHSSDRSDTYKARWVRTLLAKGKKPAMDILALVRNGSWSEMEKFWIRTFKEAGARLTNANEGGRGCVNPSRETREKIGRSNSIALKGRKHSPEQYAKLLKRARDPEYRLRMRKKMKGLYKNTEEAKEKIRRAFKGKPLSEEHKRKIGAANLGKRHSEETRLHISVIQIGRRLTDKQKESRKNKYAEKVASGWVHPLKGGRVSKEAKKRMSEAHKGITFSKERIEKSRIGHIGLTYKHRSDCRKTECIKCKEREIIRKEIEK